MIVVERVEAETDATRAGDEVLQAALPGSGFSLVDEIRKREGLGLVATRGGRVVGAFVGWIVLDELHILSIGADPGARRAGVGRALLGAAIAEARARGAVRALLEVGKKNAAAIALYRDFGFRVTRARTAYYPDGDDALELEVRWGADGAPLHAEGDP